MTRTDCGVDMPLHDIECQEKMHNDDSYTPIIIVFILTLTGAVMLLDAIVEVFK